MGRFSCEFERPATEIIAARQIEILRCKRDTAKIKLEFMNRLFDALLSG